MHDPTTPEQWQHAVDLADWYMHVDAARAYGLIRTEMQIDVERCHQLLDRGAARGITPSKDAPEKLAAKCVRAAQCERRSA
jgi:hypothetical protein